MGGMPYISQEEGCVPCTRLVRRQQRGWACLESTAYSFTFKSRQHFVNEIAQFLFNMSKRQANRINAGFLKLGRLLCDLFRRADEFATFNAEDNITQHRFDRRTLAQR